VALGHIVATTEVETVNDRVFAQKNSQPPTIADFAFLIDEHQPTCFIRLAKQRRPIPLNQGVLNQREDRLQSPQTVGHRAACQVQAMLLQFL